MRNGETVVSPKETKEKVQILIVEDSATQAEQLKYLLEEEGYTVTVASNGKQALTVSRQRKSSMVISDIVMPEMDGYTLCHEIKSDATLKDIPVLLLTSLAGAEEVLKALQCGADNFARKPYDGKRLLSLVGSILANRETRKAAKMQLGLEIDIAGEKHFITSERQQILDLLLSTFMEAVQLNRDLQAREKELQELTKQLEQKVEERTAALKTEIAERKQLETQLYQAQKMEAIGRLAGGIAHDFNNHLGIIIGYSERMLDRLGSEDPLRKSAGLVKDAALRSAALTRQLLAFSRRQVFEPAILDLNDAITDLGKMLRPLIGEDIELVASLDPALGKVKVDPAQIDQVIMNLAINSRDAMPQGGRLTIETANVELDESYARTHATVLPGPYIMLAVTDSGIGMDKKTQSHMFEPFFTTKEKGKGTGLGLATIYGIVKQSGGYIWVYSEPGRGTTFKIYLPRLEAGIQEVRVEKASPSLLKGEETILVVEDEGMIRELACLFLQESGYKVLDAANGAEAMEVSKRHPGPIQLLMTDAVMPGMNGRELAQTLRQMRAETKVLYVSGYTDDSVLRNGLLESGTAFLQKPFTRDALARKVREVLKSGKGGPLPTA
ncbi:MAG: response regulator [Acidobacteria bacterium]|nr:response regulator [Acidobacteriota bacterium]